MKVKYQGLCIAGLGFVSMSEDASFNLHNNRNVMYQYINLQTLKEAMILSGGRNFYNIPNELGVLVQ